MAVRKPFSYGHRRKGTQLGVEETLVAAHHREAYSFLVLWLV